MKVEILCGLPGSGKSTYMFKECPKEATVCSADAYFIKEGKYIFSPDSLKKAHLDCMKKYIRALQMGRNHIVVDNTNLTEWEIAPYYRLAEVEGYDVEVVIFHTPFEVCLSKQTHQVPYGGMEMFRDLFAKLTLPPWVKFRIVHRGV